MQVGLQLSSDTASMSLEVAVTKLEEKAANYNEYQVGEPCESRAACKDGSLLSCWNSRRC